MDSEEFRNFGKAAVDYIADYMDTIRNRPVLPNVQPKYLYEKIPNEIPKQGEHWKFILQDFDKVIMPGITHWQSPNFHAFFPTGSSFPSIVGELMSGALGIIGFHWAASPACTELEVIMMNWMAKMLGLPDEFLNSSPGPGGGVLQGSASESTLICLLVAKQKMITKLKMKNPGMSSESINQKLVAYTSDQANSSVEKAAILGNMPIRILPADKDGRLTSEALISAFKSDIDNQLIPCYVIANFGSTGICSFDRLDELGPVCEQYDVWLHVDAAYAGAALILPEYKYLLDGVSYASSFSFNPHKWLLVTFDCSALWVKNSNDLVNTLSVNRIYLNSDNNDVEDTELPEYRNWQIPLGRRFRSLKLWFTLRTYGLDGLQANIRKQINLALLFASLVEQDDRFEIVTPVTMGLVCFRLKGDNELTEVLHVKLTASRKIYMIVATINNKLMIRFVICSRLTEEHDIHYAWNEILTQTNNIFHNRKHCQHNGDVIRNHNGTYQQLVVGDVNNGH